MTDSGRPAVSVAAFSPNTKFALNFPIEKKD